MRRNLHLPLDDREALKQALEYHKNTNLAEMSNRAVEWTLCHYFLQGVRNISVSQWAGFNKRSGAQGTRPGTPTVEFQDEKGVRRIRVELLPMYVQSDMGRFLAMDFGPRVVRDHLLTLDSLRNCAIGEALLSSWWNQFDHTNFMLNATYMLSNFGTVGFGAFNLPKSEGYGKYGVCANVIPPWELMPLPSSVIDVDQLGGICWRRWVPLEWAKKAFKGQLAFASDSEMDIKEGLAGTRLNVEVSPDLNTSPAAVTGVYTPTTSFSFETESKHHSKKDASIKFVELCDYWTQNDYGQCLHHIVTLGNHVAATKDWVKEMRADPEEALRGVVPLPYVPVSVARRLTVGSFWGRGLSEVIRPLIKEYELLTSRHVSNMMQADDLTALIYPATAGINKTTLETMKRHKTLPYTPAWDHTGQLKPEIIGPPDLRDGYGPTLAMLRSIMDGMAGQGELDRGGVPGRVDAGSAIEKIAAMQEKGFAPAIASMSQALSHMYKVVLDIMRDNLKSEKLPIAKIDESLLGVVLDPETMTMSVAENPVPDPRTLVIGVRSDEPRNKEKELLELKEAIQSMRINRFRFEVEVYRRGLDPSGIPSTRYHQWMTAWIENLTLFGDGRKPGTIDFYEEVDDHSVHAAVHFEAMSMPIWRASSKEVRTSFIEHFAADHKQQLGGLPADSMNLDVASEPVDMPPDLAGMQMAGMEPPMPGGQLPPFPPTS